MTSQVRNTRPLDVRVKPDRDDKYLAHVRRQRCCVCRTRWQVEAAHTGPHGIGIKSSDYSAIPLCHACHQTKPDAYHKLNETVWAKIHDVVITDVIAKLRESYGQPVDDFEYDQSEGAFTGDAA